MVHSLEHVTMYLMHNTSYFLCTADQRRHDGHGPRQRRPSGGKHPDVQAQAGRQAAQVMLETC